MKYGKIIAAAVSTAIFAIGVSYAFDDSPGEWLKATPDRFDAGTVAEGKNVEVTTTVQNTGNTQVEITNVKTS